MTDAFCHALSGLVAASPHTRPRPEYSDEKWLRVGIQRVLEPVSRGRAFLQKHGPRFDSPPRRPNYFAALQGERRRDLARGFNLLEALLARVCSILPEPGQGGEGL